MKLQDRVEELEAQLEEATKLVAEKQDKLLNSYAEREHIRKVALRDVENAKEFGIKSFAVKLFDVLDTLDLCLANFPITDSTPKEVVMAFEGVKTTKAQFNKVMADYDVTPNNTQVGETVCSPPYLPNSCLV